MAPSSAVTALSAVVALCRRAAADALALLLPVDCAGCAEPDVSLCPRCVQALEPSQRRSRTPGGLTVMSGLEYRDEAARCIRLYKEQGRWGLARRLGHALAVAASGMLAEHPQTPSPAPVLLVPVPSSRAAFRRRGFRVVDSVARGGGLAITRLLVLARATADQRGLSRSQRRRNVHESMRVRQGWMLAGVPVLILDDVVTTGATLDEAARALRAVGAIVIGAATIAATPARLPGLTDERGANSEEKGGDSSVRADYRGGTRR